MLQGDVMKKGLFLILKSKHLVVLVLIFLTSVILGGVIYTHKSVNTSTSVTEYPTVIIDAGHGGVDGGTQSDSGVLEKDINLSISQKLKEILDSNGFKTVMVRSDDRLIYDDNCTTVRSQKSSDLHNRLKIMKNHPGCIFLSIHQNHFTESKYKGAQVFYRPDHYNSKILAESIQKSIISSLQTDNTRQIKPCTSEIFLIYNAVSTAVMIECGFLSNRQEAESLNNDLYQKSMAMAIAQGLIDFFTIRM